MWRPDDEALLERLEDEELLARMFRHHVGAAAPQVALHPRAAGLFAVLRRVPGGAEAMRRGLDGDVAALVRFVEAGPMSGRPPELLHHLAVYFGKVASTLEGVAADAAANAWTRALAAWLALADEHAYLAELAAAVLGDAAARERGVAIPPDRVPLEIVAELGRRAEATSRDLAPPGRAALLALAWIPEAARLAGAKEETLVRARAAAERRRDAALDAALAVVGEALDDASARGRVVAEARGILLRALDVWAWSGQDEAVEQFVVDRISTVGWEMYRARDWDALRALLEPFRPLIEALAGRIEADPSRIAYAAPCAQMFVFMSDVERAAVAKMALAERAVRLCPTHRNGRLVLASLLCDEAQAAVRGAGLFTRRGQLDRAEALVARAERLYPQSRDLPETRALLDRARKGSTS